MLLLFAGVSVALLGLIHSSLGEALIFRHYARFEGMPGMFGLADMGKRIVRVTWHIPSLLALAIGVTFARWSALPTLGEEERFALVTIAIALSLCSVLTAFGTRARHPGWIGFLVAAGLTFAALP